MEQMIYSNGKDIHISNARVMVKTQVLATHNIASIDTKKNGKLPLGGITIAIFGALFLLSGLSVGETGMSTFGFIMVLIGGGWAALRWPKSQVIVMTNAGQPIEILTGTPAQANVVAQAIGQAIVANQTPIHQASPEAPGWAHVEK